MWHQLSKACTCQLSKRLAIDGFFFVWFASAVVQTHPSTFVILFQSRIITIKNSSGPKSSVQPTPWIFASWATPILHRSAMCGRAMHDWLLLCRWCLEQLRWCGGSASRLEASLGRMATGPWRSNVLGACEGTNSYLVSWCVLIDPLSLSQRDVSAMDDSHFLTLSHHFLTTYRWNVFITSILCHLVMGPTNNHCNSPSKKIDI